MSRLIANLSQIGIACSNERVSPVLAAYYARLMMEQQRQWLKDQANKQSHLDSIDPRPPYMQYELPLEKLENGELNSNELALINHFLTPLLNQTNNAALSTLTLQVEFESLYAIGQHLSIKQQQDREQLIDSLIDECLVQMETCRDTMTEPTSNEPSNQPNNQGNNQQFESPHVPALYRSIFSLLLHHDCQSADPSKTDRAVHREIAAALESVFPPASIRQVVNQTTSQQRSLLRSLLPLTLGIRALNSDIGRGGAGLVDVRGVTVQSINQLQSTVESEIVFINQVADTYASYLLQQQTSSTCTPTEQSRLVDELIHRRQYLLFLQALTHEISQSMQLYHSVTQSITQLLSQLTSIVGLRSSVPRSTVFPLFQQLGDKLIECLSINQSTSRRSTLMDLLKQHRNPFITELTQQQVNETINQAATKPTTQPIEQQQFDGFVQSIKSSSPNKPEEESKEILLDASPSASSKPLRIPPSSPEFMSLALDYQGYCPVTLANHINNQSNNQTVNQSDLSGLLVPGDPRYGIVRYKGLHFAFRSIDAMKSFCASPDLLIEYCQRVALQRPALVQLLQFQAIYEHTDIAELITPALIKRAARSQFLSSNQTSNQTASQTNDKSMQSLFPPLPAVSVNDSTQTALHIIDETQTAQQKQDPDYHWNEWELRRRALKYASLRTKLTHSTQTDSSHFRRENSVQTTLPPLLPDGSVTGQATQTRCEATTMTDKTTVRMINLNAIASSQGKPYATQSRLVLPDISYSTTNPDLRKSA